MKKINASYYEFFFFRYAIIVFVIHLVMVPITLIYKEKDIPLLFCVTIPCCFFLFLICFSEYRRLKKNIQLAEVKLTDNTLLINNTPYSAGQIDGITSLSVRDALDKYNLYLVEFKTADCDIYYCLDKPMNWKFESPTIQLLNKHAQFSSKTKESTVVTNGFQGLKQKK